MAERRWRAMRTWLVLLCVAPFAVAATSAQSGGERVNAVGAAVGYLWPDTPLEAGPGFSLFYRRSLGATPWRWSLAVELGITQGLDREPTGEALEGELDLYDLAVGVTRRLHGSERWSFDLVGGIDWLDGDGAGTFRSDPATGITNDYDLDPGLGFHAGFEASRAVGARCVLFLRGQWLVADLDGTHAFVIDGQAGESIDVSLDASGPKLDLGAAWRF